MTATASRSYLVQRPRSLIASASNTSADAADRLISAPKGAKDLAMSRRTEIIALPRVAHDRPCERRETGS